MKHWRWDGFNFEDIFPTKSNGNIFFITACSVTVNSPNRMIIYITKIVLVIWAAITKYHRQGGLSNRYVYISSWDQKAKVKTQAFFFLVKSSLLASCCVFTWWRESTRVKEGETKINNGTNSITKAPLSWPNYLPRLHLHIDC